MISKFNENLNDLRTDNTQITFQQFKDVKLFYDHHQNEYEKYGFEEEKNYLLHLSEKYFQLK